MSILLISSCRQSEEATAGGDKPLLSPDERYEELFVDVQMARIFPDGKTFVDAVPLFPDETILQNYRSREKGADFDLRTFVEQHFDIPGLLATGFSSDTSRSAIEHINALWPVLTRQPDADDAGSLLPLPHPYVVPGGRFREIYYWDSYFTMLGLRAAGRISLIQNMIDNFAYLIDTIGFIPNGNRSYFLTRSQPPFFASMVELLAGEKGDSILLRYLPQLRREYDFWMEGREELSEEQPANQKVVRLPDGSILNRYWDKGSDPRPESYREDVETAQRSGRPAAEVYRHLRSAAESGWDFSSRWLSDPKDLATIRTTEIIPVDLNSLLFHLEQTLARAYRLAQKPQEAARFEQLAEQRRQALLRYNWDPEQGYFMDYDFTAGQTLPVLSLAGVFPLFFQLVDDKTQAEKVAEAIERHFLQPGGVRSTVYTNGQQWDAPNGWAPLQWTTIKGLRNYGFLHLADTIKNRWVELNLRVYKNTGKMVEKYNVSDLSLEAGGGEYPVQDGFGWTNGVLLHLLTENQ